MSVPERPAYWDAMDGTERCGHVVGFGNGCYLPRGHDGPHKDQLEVYQPVPVKTQFGPPGALHESDLLTDPDREET
jgi:hypothetical protein